MNANVGQPPVPNSQGSGHQSHDVKVALIGAGALILVALISSFVTLRVSDDRSPTEASAQGPTVPPSIRLETLKWVNENAVQVTGRTEGLAPGQLVWTFNQPSGPDDALTLYIDPGPCHVESNGDFRCNTGTAGEAKDSGREFTIWAAIVDSDRAASLAEKKARGSNEATLSSSADIGQVEGTETNGVTSTVASIELPHP